MSVNRRISLALTPGDPAGIGTDLAVELAKKEHNCKVVAICDRNLLDNRARQLNMDVQFEDYTTLDRNDAQFQVLHVDCAVNPVAGQPDTHNADYVLKTLDRAIDGCMNHEFDAMVTGPVSKEVISKHGFPFSGHTEYIAAKTETPLPVMLLATDQLRVALATTHIPLSEVPSAISCSQLTSVIQILHRDLVQKFGISSPRISVCGLNPHAGEGGTMGMEELETIIPAIQSCQQEGLNIEGPIPADTAFTQQNLSGCDAVLAMYHDQGLPVIKHNAFGNVVNITLGLPIIRTSVDHGTAFDLAGTGKANPGSLLAAVQAAVHLVAQSHVATHG